MSQQIGLIPSLDSLSLLAAHHFWAARELTNELAWSLAIAHVFRSGFLPGKIMGKSWGKYGLLIRKPKVICLAFNYGIG